MSGVSGSEASSPLPRLLAVAILVLGMAVSFTVVPGVFSVDDNNYLINVLALRQGRFTVANTEGLSPSRELLFFDPGPWARAVDSTPVASNAPPLYALLALPFLPFGWRGLVALNTLAYLATTVMVFLYTRRYATETSTAWMAAAAFSLGGFVIEYAQGVWPHALSIALCTGGIFAAGRSIESRESVDCSANRRPPLAAAAGFLLGLATGVRYQNAVILAVVAGGIALWSAHRWKTVIAYVVAAAAPLSASAVINHIRLGSWNPISKGDNYLTVPLLEGTARSLLDPLVTFWARVVDFSVRPPMLFPWVSYDPVTGAHLMIGSTLQKSLLQSSPWAILALILFTLAWLPWFQIPEARQRQTRLLSLVTLAVLAVFAFAGVSRIEGLSFNQRYLLELLPLAAVGFAWALDGLNVRLQRVFIGALSGVLLVVMILWVTPMFGGPEDFLWLARILSLLKLPLVFSAALTVFWFLARSRQSVRSPLAATAGLCLGWGLALHVADDVATSHRLRAHSLAQTEALGRVLPTGSALVAYWGNKDAAVPLLFDRDIVILDARADEGRDAPILIGELLNRNRRVFVLQNGFPGEVLRGVISGRQVMGVGHPGASLVELRAGPH